jgi:hypothetical protein
LSQHLRASALTASALAVALSGVSFALLSLPNNSVGTNQIRHKAVHKSDIAKGAVTAGKLGVGTLRMDGLASSLGLTGSVASAAPDRVLVTTTITTTGTGRIFAFGRGLYSVTCATPGTAVQAGLYVDGAAVTGSGASLPSNGSATELNLFGMTVAHLAPGSHSLQLKADCATGSATGSSAAGDAALGGILVHD